MLLYGAALILSLAIHLAAPSPLGDEAYPAARPRDLTQPTAFQTVKLRASQSTAVSIPYPVARKVVKQSHPSQSNNHVTTAINVTVTTVVDGKTETAVWQPKTLTQYSNLKASTTITMNQTVTRNSSSEVETVVAVVFAGGVLWWLAGKSLSCLENQMITDNV